MVMIEGFENGFNNKELYTAMGGKSAGKNMKPRGGCRAHGAKVFGFAGVALCCSSGKESSCASAERFAMASPEDPETFEAVVDGCPTDAGHAQKLKDLKDAAQQDKVVVFSNQPAKVGGWVWHGFYTIDIVEVLANPELARIRYTKRDVAAADAEAMRWAASKAVDKDWTPDPDSWRDALSAGDVVDAKVSGVWMGATVDVANFNQLVIRATMNGETQQIQIPRPRARGHQGRAALSGRASAASERPQAGRAADEPPPFWPHCPTSLFTHKVSRSTASRARGPF
ncbi:hypothetical protein JL721_3045 [Aureococcus anophagefferens]|nr:hypothetical protein JL721_3045 [Aureococcus anophagefferens]